MHRGRPQKNGVEGLAEDLNVFGMLVLTRPWPNTLVLSFDQGCIIVYFYYGFVSVLTQQQILIGGVEHTARVMRPRTHNRGTTHNRDVHTMHFDSRGAIVVLRLRVSSLTRPSCTLAGRQ